MKQNSNVIPDLSRDLKNMIMKKLLISAALLSAALLLAACGGNPAKQGNQAPQTPSAEDFETMQGLYEESDEDHGWKPLCKWQYIDLDGDGVNEVWMRDMAEEYGAFYAVSDDYLAMIGIETDRFKAYTREPQDGKGWWCKGGPAGGPSYYTEVITLQNSRITDRYYQMQVYDDIEGTLNGEDLDDAACRAYTEALPEAKELEAGEWNILDLTDYDRVPAHKNSAKDDQAIMDFIREMYNSSLYVEDAFLEEHCTPRMLQQLRDDYEYEGEGYANWDFRSESNDGFSDENGIISIEKIDGRYYYEANDAGYIFRNILSAFIQDGIVMFDGITRDATYPVHDPFAEDAE